MNILIAVDLDEPTSFTRDAVEMAHHFDGNLYVLHVFDASVAAYSPDQFPIIGGFQPYESYDPQLEQNLRHAEEDAFHAFLTERFDRTIHPSLQEGDPASVILDDAEELDAGLIILGKRHHSALERFFVGSVASQVVKHTKRPTLLLPVADDKEERRSLAAEAS